MICAWATVVGAIVLVALGLSALPTQAPTARQVPAAGQLYVSGELHGAAFQQWRALDPHTLADDAGATPPFDPVRIQREGATNDGRLLASIEYIPSTAPAGEVEVALVVQDAATGAEMARVPAPGPVCCPRLSADGSRLLVRSRELQGRGMERLHLYVVSTRDGEQFGRFTAPEPDWRPTLIDPALRRVYRPIMPSSYAGPGNSGSRGPRSLRLIAYDLTSGAQVEQLDLPDVPAGAWATGSIVQPLLPEGLSVEGAPAPMPRHDYMGPGVALSPDGRRLAVVHADAAVLTLVDTEPLALARRLPLTRAVGWLDHLLPGPRVAVAKVLGAGTGYVAVFAPDGRHLYVYGWSTTLDAGDHVVYHGLGVQLIDVERGAIVAETLGGEQVVRLLPAPDGASIYVLATPQGAGLVPVPGQYRLRRLSADRLTVLAEREFTDFREPLLWPPSSYSLPYSH